MNRRKPSAFTLVELLVVMAIVAVLAALLLPAIGRVRDRVVRTVDINNLKQLVTATHLHATDNGDALPWMNWLSADAADRPGWLYTLDAAASGPARFKAQTGLLWPAIQNPKIYLCPRDDPGHPMFKYREQQISSYVMNGAASGYFRVRYPPLHLSAFPADAVLFWETDEQEPGFFNDGSSRPDEGVSGRHDAGAICATFGGAVHYVKFEDWYRDASSTNKCRLWCYPESPDGR